MHFDRSKLVEPELTYREAISELGGIEQVELFNRSGYQLLLEKWCAGMFGLGYAQHVRKCLVAVNDTNNRIDADFFLCTDGQLYPFQTVEVLEPGRRRGEEYKEFAGGRISSVPYEPERGYIEGPEWINRAIKKKISKRYANSRSLNLLLYANFSARQLAYDRITQLNIDLSAAFHSVWVITETHLCSIRGNDDLGAVNGWGEIPFSDLA